MSRQNIDQTFDAALELKDAGAVAASGAATVGGAARVIDMGAARFDGRAILDVAALTTAEGDELYTVEIQGSSSPTFASGNAQLASFKLGDSSVTGGSADTVPGRYEFGVTNQQNGVTYRYVRAFTRVAGGNPPSINYTAFLAKKA